VNQLIKHLGKRSFRSKDIVRIDTHRHTHQTDCSTRTTEVIGKHIKLEMWANAQRDGRPANIGGALCSTPQSFADAHYYSAVQ